jgi:hypothetical protein
MDTLSVGVVSAEPAGIFSANTVESFKPAVSWGAIFAGAFVVAAASVILAALGSGLGLASVSPWPNRGASLTTFTVMTAIWLIVIQWVASGVGGYLTGRLRTKWVGTHTHEVFFRDTAHGFVTWAVATVIVAGLFASAALSGASSGVRAASNELSTTSVAPYDVDLLFRSVHSEATPAATDARAEVARILAQGATTGDVPASDRTYLTELVTAHTGVSREEAQRRVDNAIAQAQAINIKARQAADAARKAAAATSIFTGLSMLVGAFIACIAAALGGRRRDVHA